MGSVARAAASLPSLALSRGGLDRRSELRTEPGPARALLDDPGTRVLELVDGRAEVERRTATTPRSRCATARRSAGDRDRFVAYLGHDAPAGGTAYVLSVADDAWDTADDEPTRSGLRAVGRPARRPRRRRPHDGDRAWRTGTAATASARGAAPRRGRPGRAGSGCARSTRSEHYPRTDPAVIMSVVDADDRLLLARGAGFAAQGMSVLAGFVEPGESLAAAVAREVHEEVGVVVEDVHLPRGPAVAVPVLAHGRLHGAGGLDRAPAAGGRDRGGPLVHP